MLDGLIEGYMGLDIFNKGFLYDDTSNEGIFLNIIEINSYKYRDILLHKLVHFKIYIKEL